MEADLPPPRLKTFDAPDREKCTVERERTNTPLQALVLLNDPTYVEAARKLAERMMREGGTDPADRVAFAFRLATARLPGNPRPGRWCSFLKSNVPAFLPLLNRRRSSLVWARLRETHN